METEGEQEYLSYKNLIPFGVTRRGEIVCIPKSDDPPTVGVFGTRGSGKTTFMIGSIGRIFRNYRDPLIVANDYTSESFGWFGRQERGVWLKQIKFLGETAYKLPIVQVYPNNKDLYIEKDSPYYFRYGFSFKKFIDNIENHFDIKRSLTYFKNISEEIKNLKNPNIESVNEIIYGKKIQMPKESRDMLSNIITWFFKEGLLDLEEGTTSQVRMVEGDKDEGVYDLIPALAYSGRIPTFMTSSMMGKKYLHIYFANVLKCIRDTHQVGYPQKRGKVLHVFIDEISKLTSKKEKTACTEVINEFFKIGRPLKIGVWYATQNASLLPSDIKTNTKYAICFSSDKSEIRAVSEKFHFDKREVNVIANLKKRIFNNVPMVEFYAKTIDEEFVFLDPLTGKRYKSRGGVQGILIPPICSTQPPRPVGEL